MKKIYLAGFDVFAPDAVQRGAQMKLQCAQNGLIGLYPLDNEADGAAAVAVGAAVAPAEALGAGVAVGFTVVGAATYCGI